MKGLIIFGVVIVIILCVVGIYWLVTAPERSNVRRRDVNHWKTRAREADARLLAIETHVQAWWDETSILAQSVRDELNKYQSALRKKEAE